MSEQSLDALAKGLQKNIRYLGHVYSYSASGNREFPFFPPYSITVSVFEWMIVHVDREDMLIKDYTQVLWDRGDNL